MPELVSRWGEALSDAICGSASGGVSIRVVHWSQGIVSGGGECVV